MFHSFSLFIPKFHLGLIWSEVKQLWDIGLHEYVNDMWNVIDFVTNSLYVATVALRVVSYFQVTKTFVSIEKSVVCSFIPIRFISFSAFNFVALPQLLFLLYVYFLNFDTTENAI